MIRSMSETTVTLELAQVAKLDEHLTRHRHAAVTAGRLGLESIPEKAVLQRVTASGPPCFPYVQGYFSEVNEPVELHTSALSRLSKLWHLHQHWGV